MLTFEGVGTLGAEAITKKLVVCIHYLSRAPFSQFCVTGTAVPKGSAQGGDNGRPTVVSDCR